MDIQLINPSDIISESMHKINYNFDQIKTHDDLTEYKLTQLSKSLRSEIDGIKDAIDYKNVGIMKNIDELGKRVTALPSLDNIQNAIDAALSNISGDLEDFVRVTAGQQINYALGPYARTSDIDAKGYITSSAFSKYTSDADKRTASLSHIVANSTFMKDEDGYYIWGVDGYYIYGGTQVTYSAGESVSGVSDVGSFYYSKYILPSEKEEIDGDSEYENKLEDPAVVGRLITLCERKLKQVAMELAGISAAVAEGYASANIIAAVKDHSDPDNDIVAAIFVEATEMGSSIKLSANNLDLTGDNLVINTKNFQVNTDSKGTVIVKGALEATSLKIGDYDLTTGDGARGFVRAYQEPSSGGDSDDDSAWLREAFQETSINGGLAMTGNILVADKNGNITAGMMGYDRPASNEDIRFFAGTKNLTSQASLSQIMDAMKNAPFRVYENGHVVLEDAVVSGEITANKFDSTSDVRDLEVNGSKIGTYTIGTFMDSDQFQVYSKTKKTGESNEREAKIYVTILPELSLDDIEGVPDELAASAIADDGKLIGVPVLCFDYKGKTYYMTPGAWKTGAGSVNTSNMYFTTGPSIYSAVEFTVGSSASHNNGEYYTFNPDKNNLRKTYGTRYNFGYDFGSLSGSDLTSAQQILNNHHLYTGSVALDLPANQGYIYNSRQKCTITDERATDFEGKLRSGAVYERFGDIYNIEINEHGAVSQVDLSELNPGVAHYLKDWVFQSGSNWDWETQDWPDITVSNIGGFVASVNPFWNIEGNSMVGGIDVNIEGGYKTTYTNGELTTTSTKEAFGLCEYNINIIYNSADYTVCGSKYYKPLRVSILVKFGVYSSGFTADDGGETKIMDILNNDSTITSNISTDISIFAKERISGTEELILTFNR